MMNNKGILYVGLLVLYTITLISCEKDDNTGDPEENLVTISSAFSEDESYELVLYARDTLFEGYNKLFISVADANTGNMITEANLALRPMMHMVDKNHAAPCENPAGVVNEDGYFEGAAVFIMPSNPDEGWVLNVDLDVNGSETTAVLDIPVVRYLEEARKIKVTSAIDETIYFVSLVEPMDPKVGINDCIFCIHYKESMMSFPAAEDLIMEIEPEMPSMEHGSPNNVNPVHTENGHYAGKINFTMTGWWRVHLTLKKGEDIVCDDKYMDITLE